MEMKEREIVHTVKFDGKKVTIIPDPWEDIPDTYDKPKLCKIEDSYGV